MSEAVRREPRLLSDGPLLRLFSLAPADCAARTRSSSSAASSAPSSKPAIAQSPNRRSRPPSRPCSLSAFALLSLPSPPLRPRISRQHSQHGAAPPAHPPYRPHASLAAQRRPQPRRRLPDRPTQSSLATCRPPVRPLCPSSGVHRETGEADQARAALCREADRAWLRPEELARRQQTAYGGSCHCSSSQLAVSSALRSSGPAPVAVGRGDDAALPRIWSERRTERRPSSSALRLAFELAKLLSARWSRSPTRAELWLRRARGELGLAGRLSSRRPPALLLTSSAPPLSEG